MEDCSQLQDDELLGSLKRAVKSERRNLAGILSRLAEVDRRSLAHKRGFRSLFDYCLRELRYSEPEAALRIHAARSAAKFPLLYPMLSSGRLSLTAISMLAPHLTPQNHRNLIRRSLGKSKRDLESLVASLSPEREPMDRIRHIGPPPERTIEPAADVAINAASLFDESTDRAPAAAVPTPPTGESRPTYPAPAPADPGVQASGRVHIAFCADEDLLRDLQRAKDLLRHRHPTGRLEDVIGDALDALLDRIDPQRRFQRQAARGDIRPGTQGKERPCAVSLRDRVPKWVRDAVWRRDGGQCAFVGPDGRRCEARAWLEYDHIIPRALGGKSDDPAGIRLLCRSHNILEARRLLGDAPVDAAIARSARRRLRDTPARKSRGQ